MGLFYTGKGDGGYSDFGKKKTTKDCAEIEALGDLDELNSLLGLVRSKKLPKEFKNILLAVQENLFIIQANIGVLLFGGKYSAPKLRAEKIKEMEKIIDKLEKLVRPGKGFIISGEEESSAWLDYARTVARRAERSVLKMKKQYKIAPEIFAYLNRLSSLLFACARAIAKKSRVKEPHPRYR